LPSIYTLSQVQTTSLAFWNKVKLLKVHNVDGEGMYFWFGGDTKQEIFYLATILNKAEVEEAMWFIKNDLKQLEAGLYESEQGECKINI
jgi:hypothetical protein